MDKRIKVVDRADTRALAKDGKLTVIKGTLYILPNGDRYFEAAASRRKDDGGDTGYKLVYSDGVTKHWTTKHRHLFQTSFSIETTDPVGALYMREVANFCAEAAVKGIGYYVKERKL